MQEVLWPVQYVLLRSLHFSLHFTEHNFGFFGGNLTNRLLWSVLHNYNYIDYFPSILQVFCVCVGGGGVVSGDIVTIRAKSVQEWLS